MKRGWVAAALAGTLCLAASAAIAEGESHAVLTVCADPNNLPFSNRAGEGFENKIANVIAHDLHARLHYVWWAQRRGYARNTLSEAKCDLWPGVAAGVGLLVAVGHPAYNAGAFGLCWSGWKSRESGDGVR